MKNWKSYELEIARKFSVWWESDDSLKTVRAENLPFRRTPMSGGWSKKTAVCDLVVPDNFPFVVELRARNSWNFDEVFKGGGKIKAWLDDTVDKAKASLMENGNPRKGMLVFTRNYQPDYVMLMYADFLELVGYNSRDAMLGCRTVNLLHVAVGSGFKQYMLMMLNDFFEGCSSAWFRQVVEKQVVFKD